MKDYFEQSPEKLEEFLDLIEDDIENVRRVLRSCKEENLDTTFIVHPKANSASQSAENTGIDPERIVKTLVFRSGEEFVAVLCPGDKTVDESKLEEITEKDVRMADPEEVEDETGYKVGGVSPFDLDIPVYIEGSILKEEKVKPSAGSRVVGLKADPEQIKEAVEGKVADIGK